MPVTILIKGSRVTLRRLKRPDAALISVYTRDKLLLRLTDIKRPVSLKGARNFIKRSQHDWRKRKSFTFGIVLSGHDSDLIIGVVSFTNLDHKNNSGELEFWMGKEYRGKGLMKEAIKSLLRFGFSKLNLHRVFARTLRGNSISAHVLECVGFKREGELREALFENGRRNDILVFGLLKRDFKN